MNLTVYFSVQHAAAAKKLESVILDKMRIFGFLGNVTPHKSVVWSKVERKTKVEHGFKVDIVGTKTALNEHTLIAWYLAIKDNSKIHCVWVDWNNYHGCILNMQYYKDNYRFFTEKLLKCSEY